MEKDQKNAFFAVILSGVILFGWQYFFGAPTVNTPVAQEKVASNSVDSSKPQTVINNTVSQNESSTDLASSRSEVILKNKAASFKFYSDFTFEQIEHNSSVFTFTDTVGTEDPLKINFSKNGKSVATGFNFSKLTDNSYNFVSTDGLVSGSVTLDSKGFLNFVVNNSEAIDIQYNLHSTQKKLDNGQDRSFVYLSDDFEKITVGDDDSLDENVKYIGIDFNYHIFAIAFKNKVQSLLKTTIDEHFTTLQRNINSTEFNVYFLKKEYKVLKDYGNNLHLSVDFGIWSILAEVILYTLQWFHTFIPNYGLAIIFLTLVIRSLTFPLQYKSFKSMKKMQDIQPQLTKIREKFKEDPQRLQRESMELFKKAGVNPLGGCLPMLLQMPIFFAFYRVLYSSVELVNAPFYFWIHDLSNKDPYYILPLLMTAAMFLQQKFTPTATADPTQKKVMMFMPLVFGLIMKDLPSGLSLYIFISTIFGILQQLLVYRRN